eukprot:TRINITY_DN10297_c0_g1_i1.p1 TRINITY_DN10297_c0_g1~~TRINITY_DN10297_c0_g1_i1.p1  ORF type:complete len:155 (+),score=19.93 TRINITY_DN10297_c0_g1_i1:41-505(+)
MGGEASVLAGEHPEIKGIDRTEDVLQIYRTSPEQATGKKIRFVVASDTHNGHDLLTVPTGDVFVHCGDFTKVVTSHRDIAAFNEFLERLPHRYKIVVGGNHDRCVNLGNVEASKNLFTSATYLEDSQIIVEGIKIWGAPWHVKRHVWYLATGTR